MHAFIHSFIYLFYVRKNRFTLKLAYIFFIWLNSLWFACYRYICVHRPTYKHTHAHHEWKWREGGRGARETDTHPRIHLPHSYTFVLSSRLFFHLTYTHTYAYGLPRERLWPHKWTIFIGINDFLYFDIDFPFHLD